MKILVTGANGFMGHGIIRELSGSGHEIITSDFTEFTYDYKNVTSKAGNLFEIDNPYEYFGKPEFFSTLHGVTVLNMLLKIILTTFLNIMNF